MVGLEAREEWSGGPGGAENQIPLTKKIDKVSLKCGGYPKVPRLRGPCDG
jgi:hypothetical protein